MISRSGTVILLGVMIGGGLGACVRYLVLLAAGDLLIPVLFLVNVLGAFLLGMLVGLLEPSGPSVIDAEVEIVESPSLRRDRRLLTAVLGVGGLGAFTTYSAFVFEIVRLAQQAEWAGAALLLVGSLGAGVVAVAVGSGCGVRASR